MKTRPIAALTAMVAAMSVGCSGTAANSAGCKGSAISVATKFVAAVEAGDSAAYRRCEQAGASLSADAMATLASGGWLLNKAAPTDQVDPPPSKDETVIRIPAPDQPGDPINVGGANMPGFPHQYGALITTTFAGPGSYYVTKVGFYASS